MTLVVLLALAALLVALATQPGIVTLLLPLFPLYLLWLVYREVRRHPEAVRDWIQGGVAGVDRDDERQLSWLDWEIAYTRRGTLDKQARRIKLERSLLCGLIPLPPIERAVDDFYTVSLAGSQTLRVELRARDGKHLQLMDLASPGDDGIWLLHGLRDRLAEQLDPARRASLVREDGLARRLLHSRRYGEDGVARTPPAPRPPCTVSHEGDLARVRTKHMEALLGALPQESRLTRGRAVGALLTARHGGRDVSVVSALWPDPEDMDLTRFSLRTNSPLAFRARRPRGPLLGDPDEASAQPVFEVWAGGEDFGNLRDSLERSLGHLCGALGLEEVSLERGLLSASKSAQAGDLCPTPVFATLDAMVELADLCERFSPLEVRSQLASLQTRCPYCRDDLTHDLADEVVACTQCGTIHHRECWEDLTVCTIPGCGGTVARPTDLPLELPREPERRRRRGAKTS